MRKFKERVQTIAQTLESAGMRPASRFRYFGDRLICEACDGQNPQSRVRSIPRELLARRSARDEHLSEDHDPSARDRLPLALTALVFRSQKALANMYFS